MFSSKRNGMEYLRSRYQGYTDLVKLNEIITGWSWVITARGNVKGYGIKVPLFKDKHDLNN